MLIRAESEAEKARVLEIATKITVAELEARLQDPKIHTGEKQLDKSRGR